MAFFRKWKMHNKHKKLSEEWALATSLKNLSDSNEPEEGEDQDLNTFNLKYLGNTAIDAERSQNATAEAIKSVISTAKGARRKSQRVQLNVSVKGIEVLDSTSGQSLLKVSIYKISYCSADAAHDHVFAFIGSDNDSKDEDLNCFVFACPKRRIAHDVTLTVARCFENAYQNWRNSIERKMYQEQIRQRCSGRKTEDKIDKDDSIRDLLIDLTPEIPTNIFVKDTRPYLQNTWVSFDDEGKDERLLPNSWEQQQLVF